MVLPGLTSAVKAYRQGAGQLEALAGAVGDSIEAVGAALPCRWGGEAGGGGGGGGRKGG